MIEGILIAKSGLLEIGFIDDNAIYFLIKRPKTQDILVDSQEVQEGFVLNNNKIYTCKYKFSKKDYLNKIAGTGIVLTEVFNLPFN